MKFRPIIWIIALVLIACKDKFTSVPQVEAKSISPETVFRGNTIKFVSKFTDQEGDLDSILVVYKWYSGNAVTKVHDTIRESVSAHSLPPNTRDGEIILQYSYNVGGPGQFPSLTPVPDNRDTLATLGIIVIDKDSNRSNYAESTRILMKEQ